MIFKKLVGLILIVAGAYLFYLGDQQRHSLKGGLQTASATVANKIDGDVRVTDSTWYFVGGGLLVVAGAFSLLRRKA